LVTWLTEKRLTRYCFFLSAGGTLWIIFAHSKLEVIIATLIVFTAYDLIRPAITTLLTKASATGQGLINGVNMSLTSVGNIIGPIMSGALLDMNSIRGGCGLSDSFMVAHVLDPRSFYR
jgi:DHA1 family multidrug resistance protein-like MFS transporter